MTLLSGRFAVVLQWGCFIDFLRFIYDHSFSVHLSVSMGAVAFGCRHLDDVFAFCSRIRGAGQG
jgi:hypothetical protein